MFRFEVWPTKFRAITQWFGARPEIYERQGLPGHDGIDFVAPHGTQVFSVAAGTVSQVQREPGTPRSNPYGQFVVVEHADGYRTTYAHLADIYVSVGQALLAGETIGLAGKTGNTLAPHLHLTLQKAGTQFESWPNNVIDPTPFLLPFLGWSRPAGPFLQGWVLGLAVTAYGELAQTSASGINLRAEPHTESAQLALVPGGTMMIITDEPEEGYLPVLVPAAAVGESEAPASPQVELPAMVATTDGWGFTRSLAVDGSYAVVGATGINLRQESRRDAGNYGLLRPDSTVVVLGETSGEYTPVRASHADFIGPVNLVALAPGSDDADGVKGWVWSDAVALSGQYGAVAQLGANLRAAPAPDAARVAMVKGTAIVRVTGKERNNYAPIVVRRTDILALVSPIPAIETPEPLSETAEEPQPAPIPMKDTVGGWAFSSGIHAEGIEAAAGELGINLRAQPQREAENLGYVPAGTLMIVAGLPRGEYTPVRVAAEDLKPPLPADTSNNPEPQVLGQARIGLHASADPFIPQAEVEEFRLLRPGLIKVLSFHSGTDIARLAQQHPQAHWVVRAFLSFGGRPISPSQFLNDTISDVRRALEQLQGRNVVVELHNEPNLVSEGLGAAWSDGIQFGRWMLQLLRLYRDALPGVKFIYPALSPGGPVHRVRHAHLPFLQNSRAAVEASDGLAVHLYWSKEYPMEEALQTLDVYISLFPTTPIWVTEASNNKGGVTPPEKAAEYLRFWYELQRRPTVKGVTYFVASASNPDFAEEVWTGRGIAAIVGRR